MLYFTQISENKVQRTSEFYPWALWKPVNPGEKPLKAKKGSIYGKYISKEYLAAMTEDSQVKPLTKLLKL